MIGNLTTWINVFVGIEIVAMLTLAVMFYCKGNWRLAAAQACYTVATGVIFWA